MYQLIPLPKLLTYYAGFCLIVAIAIGFALKVEGWGWLRCISITLTGVSIFVAAIGQSRAFPFLCRRFPLNLLFIDIDGEWVGRNMSNWPRIETRDPNAELKSVAAKVKLEVRLFWIKMTLLSENEYSSSTTLFVRICRSDGHPRLIYTYLNRTKVPQQSDEQSHYGSAILDIIGERADTRLEGPYWTNRNWQRGQNTAGTIELRRSMTS